MKSLRLLCVLLLALGSFQARASTFSTDYTDLWWNSPDNSESGWGVNVVQQADIVFATFFVYGADGTPRWFVAPSTGALASPAGQNTFTGPLFSTTGTHFGLPWNPGASSFAQVGTVTFNFTSPVAGNVSYSVNGVQVSKNIKRQTWRTNNLAGRYFGGTTATGTNCAGVPNGPILIVGEMSVGHSNLANVPSTLTMEVDFTAAGGVASTCTYTASYRQEGKVGSADGTFNCSIPGTSNAPFGTFSLRELHANTNGITAKFTGSDQFCDYTGFFGGPRDVL